MGNASAPRRKSGVCRREALPTVGYLIIGTPAGNTLSNMYLSGHAPDKYTITCVTHRNAAAKPRRSAEPDCRRESSEAIP